LIRLLSPIRIGNMELSNRICMGELGPNGDGKGCLTERTIDFYVAHCQRVICGAKNFSKAPIYLKWRKNFLATVKDQLGLNRRH